MPKQILAILEADASRPETATERMLQVMNSDLARSRVVFGDAMTVFNEVC